MAHDSPNVGKTRRAPSLRDGSIIGRVTQACQACASNHLRCTEEKPCQRCTEKDIDCLWDRSAQLAITPPATIDTEMVEEVGGSPPRLPEDAYGDEFHGDPSDSCRVPNMLTPLLPQTQPFLGTFLESINMILNASALCRFPEEYLAN
jgi:hypothetical protein